MIRDRPPRTAGAFSIKKRGYAGLVRIRAGAYKRAMEYRFAIIIRIISPAL